MRFEERVEVPVAQSQVWDFLWQTERLAGCLPGCTGVQELVPDSKYKVQLEDRIGPYKVHFEMDAEVKERRPQDYIQLYCTGRDKLLGASQTTNLVVTLEPIDAQKTAINVAADVEVLGKVASLGQFAVKRKAKDIFNKFARNVQAELAPAATDGR